MGRGRLCPRRVFRKENAGSGHVLIEIVAFIGVMHIQAVAHHADGHTAGAEGATGGRGIDPLCQTAHHHSTAGGQAEAQLFRTGDAVGRAVPGPHHRHAEQIVQQGQLALVIEQGGRIIDVFQPPGIGGVRKGQQLNVQPLAVGKVSSRSAAP